MMKAADWCGIVKGGKRMDKSDAFPWHFDDLEKAPVVENAPVCMTCRVEQMVTVGAFHDFILKPVHTYVQEENLNERGKIDYEKVKSGAVRVPERSVPVDRKRYREMLELRKGLHKNERLF
jgi:flavin reductase (DIM6/NTAB) family NADH-FMN oxidoreductase RutF